MKDLGLLTLRLATGGLLAGHGAQKLFGSFGGPGPEGTAGWLESMGLKPGKQWAMVAGGSELGGGLLTALGLAWPLGPIASIAAMATAGLTAHRGKPIWVTSGGAELPATNIAAATALMLTGPGRISVDTVLRTRAPWTLALLAAAGAAAGVAMAVRANASATAEQNQVDVAEEAADEPAPVAATAAPSAVADAQAPLPDESPADLPRMPAATAGATR